MPARGLALIRVARIGVSYSSRESETLPSSSRKEEGNVFIFPELLPMDQSICTVQGKTKTLPSSFRERAGNIEMWPFGGLPTTNSEVTMNY